MIVVTSLGVMQHTPCRAFQPVLSHRILRYPMGVVGIIAIAKWHSVTPEQRR